MILKNLLELNEISDLHISENGQAWARKNGQLHVIDDLNEENKILLQAFFDEGDNPLVSCYNYRIHRYVAQGLKQCAIRVFPSSVPNINDLGLPNLVYKLINQKSGLVLVSGATGSGKTTTLASLLLYLAESKGGHIMTLEDPIEYKLISNKALIHQCRVNKDVGDLKTAILELLRADPDIVMIGELRSVEEIQAALLVAETGHLVLASIHSSGAVESILRVINAFDGQSKNYATQVLSEQLHMILYQQLIPNLQLGRSLACECLLNTVAVSTHIREHQWQLIHQCIESGGQYGMQTLENSLIKLIQNGILDKEVVMKYFEKNKYISKMFEPVR